MKSEKTVSDEARIMATAARNEARKLQALSYQDRKTILYAVARAFISPASIFIFTCGEATQVNKSFFSL